MKDDYDMILWLSPVFLIGMIAGILLLSCLQGSDTMPVNIPVFGERLCASQGYSFHNYTMKDSVPTIRCKLNTTESVYDGVVILEKRT